jgi:hypothetical protein
VKVTKCVAVGRVDFFNKSDVYDRQDGPRATPGSSCCSYRRCSGYRVLLAWDGFSVSYDAFLQNPTLIFVVCFTSSRLSVRGSNVKRGKQKCVTTRDWNGPSPQRRHPHGQENRSHPSSLDRERYQALVLAPSLPWLRSRSREGHQFMQHGARPHCGGAE